MRTAFYSFLPSGGAVRVAGQQLYNLRNRFDWHAYLPEGGFPLLPESKVSSTLYPFPAGQRLKGAARLAAPLLLWRKVFAYRNLCRKIALDMDEKGTEALLVHTSLIIASPPLVYLSRQPSVYYCHEYPRYIYEKGMYKTGSAATELLIAPILAWEKREDRRAARAASILVANSFFMARKLEEVYRRKAVVVSPGVDTGIFMPGGERQGNYVLTVGALSEFKRHHLVVKALSLIPEKNRPAMITVADRGEEGYAGFLTSMASRLGVDLSIERGISDQRLLEHYRNAVMVACPQRNEPYGMVPLEAMACGAAVVAVDQGGFRENVISGQNGILVQPDAMSFADAIQSLIGNPRYAAQLGSTGLDYVLSNRSSRVEAESIAALLEQASGMRLKN